MSGADAIIEQLKGEGFAHVFVWRGGPGATYPPHTHDGDTAHVVLDGAIAIEVDGTTTTYAAGERFDVPAGQVHSARAGASGCVYVVGE